MAINRKEIPLERSLPMTYVNSEADYYGRGHKEENVCSV